MSNKPLFCPTEPQVVAWLDKYATTRMREYCNWCGISLIEAVRISIYNKVFTWREAFEDPDKTLYSAEITLRDAIDQYAVAQAFDNA